MLWTANMCIHWLLPYLKLHVTTSLNLCFFHVQWTYNPCYHPVAWKTVVCGPYSLTKRKHLTGSNSADKNFLWSDPEHLTWT